ILRRVIVTTTSLYIGFSLAIFLLFLFFYFQRILEESRHELRSSVQSAASIARLNYLSGDLLALRRNLSDLKLTNKWHSVHFEDANGVILWSGEEGQLQPSSKWVLQILRLLNIKDLHTDDDQVILARRQEIFFSEAGELLGVIQVEKNLAPLMSHFLFV